jgi:hypothetical protein
MKKSLIVIGILAIVGAGTFALFKFMRPPEKMLIKMPSGEVLEAVKVEMSADSRKTMLTTTIEGKIEEIFFSSIPNDPNNPGKRTVIVSNSGELVVLANPDMVNKLNFGGYIGKAARLKGQWHNKARIRGKEYRSLWIEEILK